MTKPRILTSYEQKYRRQIRSELNKSSIVIEDEWWVRYAPAYYEKYYYAQDCHQPITYQP